MKKQNVFEAIYVVLFALVLIVACQVVAADAAVYYVATNGSDSSNGAIGTPWATPLKAFQSAHAGDTIYFRGGTYAIPQINTAGYASGSSGSPITFKSYTGETATWTSTSVSAVYINSPYYIFDGINLSSPGTFFSVSYDHDASGFTLQNATCHMTVGEGDNSGCMKVYNGNYITIQNNIIIGPGTSVNANNAGIWLDYVHHFLVKNNTISGFPSGFYFKHPNTLTNTSDEISYNYIYGCGWGLHLVSNYTLIQHNILANNTHNVYDGDDGGATNAGCNYLTFSHNTMVNGDMNFQNQGGGVGSCLHNTLQNNIFANQNTYNAYDATNLFITADYNLYPTGNIVYSNRINYTLSSWRTYSGQDAHSLSAAPTFTGSTSSGSSVTNFVLKSGSSGHNAASDGTDVGANASLVGAGGSGGSGGNTSGGGQQAPDAPILQ